MTEDQEEIAEELYKQLALLSVEACTKDAAMLTISEKCAIAICAGCAFEITATGIKITEPFYIHQSERGRLVVVRHAKKQGKS